MLNFLPYSYWRIWNGTIPLDWLGTVFEPTVFIASYHDEKRSDHEIHPGDLTGLTMRSIQEISQDRSPHRRSTHRVPRRTLKSQWDAETNIWVIWASERNKSRVSPSLSRGRNEEKWWKQNQVSITHMVLPAGLLQINVFLNKQTSAKSSHNVRQERGSLSLWIQLFDRPARWSRAKTQKWCFLGDSGDLSPISLRYFHDQLNFYGIYGILGNYGI